MRGNAPLLQPKHSLHLGAVAVHRWPTRQAVPTQTDNGAQRPICITYRGQMDKLVAATQPTEDSQGCRGFRHSPDACRWWQKHISRHERHVYSSRLSSEMLPPQPALRSSPRASFVPVQPSLTWSNWIHPFRWERELAPAVLLL